MISLIEAIKSRLDEETLQKSTQQLIQWAEILLRDGHFMFGRYGTHEWYMIHTYVRSFDQEVIQDHFFKQGLDVQIVMIGETLQITFYEHDDSYDTEEF